MPSKPQLKENVSNTNQTKPLLEQLIEFRDEAEGTLTAMKDLYHGDRLIVGKWRQTPGNVILWYSQWDKNRDYSSVANASLTLGKLASLNELLGSAIMEGGSFTIFEALQLRCTMLCDQCWENIRNATGRIVPFGR